MSAEVKAKIASELALLKQETAFPVEPFYYGSDIDCGTDVAPDLAEVDAGSTLGLAQASLRRLDCPRGENPDDANYGISLRQMLNVGIAQSDIPQMGGQIRAELSKDDRVDSLTVVVSDSSGAGKELYIVVAIQPMNRNLGPFTLTLSASSAGVLLEEIRSQRQ